MGCSMNKEAFDKLRVPGEVNWDDACVIRDTILEHKPETVLELGCFRGMSTLVIIDALWRIRHSRLTTSPFDWKFTSVDIVPMGELFNMRDIKHARRAEHVPPDAPVTHIVSDALKYLNGLPDGSIDLIFEDTNHQTAYTTKLIPEMLRVLKEKGVLIFHDLNLGTIQRAYRKTGLLKKVKDFPPSRMGMLRKRCGAWI